MKYVMPGYFNEKEFKTMSQSELNAYLDECFAYDDECAEKGTR